MKENKFRVWCEFEVNGELHKSMESPASWFLLTQAGTLLSYGPLEPPQPLGKGYKKTIPLFYTGLKDKNGVEIYEGDVVKAHHQKERKIIGDQFEKIEVVGEVKYEAPSFFLKLENDLTQNWLDFDSSAEPYEIIGNIYENPELAK